MEHMVAHGAHTSHLEGPSCRDTSRGAERSALTPTRYVNARVFTSDPDLPEANAFAINETGHIAWVGNRDSMPASLYGDTWTEVDLKGARVIPGFVDAHMHAVMLANFAPQISALPPAVNSIAELIDAIKQRRAEQGPDRWIEGWGYDEALLAEKRSPTRWDLDAASPDAPVCIMRTCGHIRCVNSRALELAGITRDTPDPAGGVIERDATGEPTGVLKETARDLVTPVIPKPTEDTVVHNLVRLGELLASQGIVAITDMCSVDGTDTLPVLRAAARSGLAQDTAAYMLWDYIKDDPESFELDADETNRNEQVFAAGIKVLTDGSVSGKTAWFYEPFCTAGDEEPTAGLATCADEDIANAIAYCCAHGCQLSLHAMGTRAIDRVAKMLDNAGLWDAKGAPAARVEHVTAPSDAAIKTFARLGIPVVTQPIFPYAEIGAYRANLGDERTCRCYPLRSMVDAGVRVCLSTDAPATSWAVPSDPFPNLKSAVTRHAYNGFDFGASERLGIEEALERYTREAARAVGFTNLGIIRPGYWGSFAVLDRDILSIPASHIDQVQVDATFIRGRKAYDRYAPATNDPQPNRA